MSSSSGRGGTPPGPDPRPDEAVRIHIHAVKGPKDCPGCALVRRLHLERYGPATGEYRNYRGPR